MHQFTRLSSKTSVASADDLYRPRLDDKRKKLDNLKDFEVNMLSQTTQVIILKKFWHLLSYTN